MSISLASCHSPAWPLSTAIYSSRPADGAPYLSFQALRASGAVRDIPAKNRATEGSKTPELPCLKMCLTRGSAAGNRRLLGALRAYELGERRDSNTVCFRKSPRLTSYLQMAKLLPSTCLQGTSFPKFQSTDGWLPHTLKPRGTHHLAEDT